MESCRNRLPDILTTLMIWNPDLVQKGLEAKDAKKWVEQVHEKKNVSIPNVILRIEQKGPPTVKEGAQ